MICFQWFFIVSHITEAAAALEVAGTPISEEKDFDMTEEKPNLVGKILRGIKIIYLIVLSLRISPSLNML